ncbi:MAG TPA: amidohydrolase family protein, partial [Methanothrix sp.]|nr:amidohydrolase family protein [Methanothrix sp.]
KGVPIAQSTDGAHYDAMFTLWNSLKRTDGRTGKSLMTPYKQITREEALKLYTINSAYVIFMEDKIGSIEPGKLADLVILNRDILKCPIDDILTTKALCTMVGGKAVHGSLDALR